MSTQTFRLNKAFPTIWLLAILMVCISCSDFVDPPLPEDEITSSSVFQNDNSVIGAVKGGYNSFDDGLSGALYPSFFADELILTNASGEELIAQENTYTPEYAIDFFSAYYRAIYRCNAILEALKDPNRALTPSVVEKAKGESKYLRAHNYFKLVNYYGAVPLIKTTDARSSGLKGNTPVDSVYSSIIGDLLSARDLLTNSYPTSSRFRVNKQAANTLLAKAYLYRKNWEEAEAYANSVIQSDLYSLESLGNIFRAGSKETIWQLWNEDGNTSIAQTLIPTDPGNIYYQVRKGLVNSFQAGDQRKQTWLKHGTGDDTSVYYVAKYKQDTPASGENAEYRIQLRLAEVYLIRAEARAHQEDLTGALSDINLIRNRAGLTTPLQLSTKEEVLDTVAHERRIELMFENGNRWFDLNRTGQTKTVLSKIKNQK